MSVWVCARAFRIFFFSPHHPLPPHPPARSFRSARGFRSARFSVFRFSGFSVFRFLVVAAAWRRTAVVATPRESRPPPFKGAPPPSMVVRGVAVRSWRRPWWTRDGKVARAMKKNVGGDGGGERKSSLRNRRRRGLDGDGDGPPPPPLCPSPAPPTAATATVTSGALHRLQAVVAASATGMAAIDDGRDPTAAAVTATTAAVTDDWLFADWLVGGSGGGGTAPATGTPLY